MDRPVRVLHVLGGLSLGGAESRIMDLYRCMDREKVQFDFLVHQDGGEMGRIPEFYDEEVGKLGGKIYTLPKFRGYNYFGYKKAVKEFFREHHEFAAVQGHMTSTAAIYLPEAAKAGILVRAAHARSAGVDKGVKGVLTRLLRLPLLKKADYCFACSKEMENVSAINPATAGFVSDWSNSSNEEIPSLLCKRNNRNKCGFSFARRTYACPVLWNKSSFTICFSINARITSQAFFSTSFRRPSIFAQ